MMSSSSSFSIGTDLDNEKALSFNKEIEKKDSFIFLILSLYYLAARAIKCKGKTENNGVRIPDKGILNRRCLIFARF
ncbi:hypothetical protein BpHYR1_015602 [Brachionus plicatilis]|uniref:Uncharacterized protein n=1 Tax=Brachionus plicatilis TaxID=10195 RepID=A0A3M7PRR3_BRAPC|nr:hypothetical protein BpHYR1_015602 [Brachionus plicatilis]